MKNKILTLLGFAAKAGKLSYGFEASVSSVKAGKAFLVLNTEDISAKSCKELNFFCNKRSIPLNTLNGFDIKVLSDAVGSRCGIVSVNDKGFAEAILKNCGGNANDQ